MPTDPSAQEQLDLLNKRMETLEQRSDQDVAWFDASPATVTRLSERIDELEKRLDSLEAHADAPTTHPRDGECVDNGKAPHWHLWRVLIKDSEPVGRVCVTCAVEHKGTMVWDDGFT